MKAKLLKKIRSRMLSITFHDEKIHESPIEIEYVDSCGESRRYRISASDGPILYLIEEMFGEEYRKRVKEYREKSLVRRNEARLKGKIRYGWK